MSHETPFVVAVPLGRDYAFMYEGFMIATQHRTFLFLEKEGERIWCLKFDSPQIKSGSPNDEARHGHPLWPHGLGYYGFFEVLHSPWIRDQMIANRVHHRHTDSLFDGDRHFIACFKDVMVEIICRSYEETAMTVGEVVELLQEELRNL